MINLTPDEAIAIATVLDKLPTKTAAWFISGGAQWKSYADARAKIRQAADDAVNADRGVRRG